MRGESLGELEELVLLAVLSLNDDAYGVSVQQQIEGAAGRPVTLGAVYSALDRLERKGYLRSRMTGAQPERGGRRKRVFTVSDEGRRAAESARRAREALWGLAEDANGRSGR